MKPDLLSECNDQNIPPRDFKETFCKRCRNQNCTNAGWSSSSFEERVRTQVDRLLINPMQAMPDDPRFAHVRAMHFVEVAAALSLARRADPWVGPGVHLAEPDPETVKSQVVEDAVSKLAQTRGRRLPTMVAVEIEGEESPLPQPQPPIEAPATVLERPAATIEAKPVATPPKPVATPVRINTDFPEEGLMIGSPVPHQPAALTAPAAPVDPWAPKPKDNVVPKGSKIRMDG